MLTNRQISSPSLLKSISEGIVVQKLEDELLIYNLQTNRAICLNQTAALVWQSCDGISSVSEIRQKLEKELGTSVNDELVLFAVSELNEKGLIENGEKIADSFKGLSRREIVRKVGFASLVALPIVSSIVAPTAAAAQTFPPPPANCAMSGTPIGFCESINSTRQSRAGAEATARRVCTMFCNGNARGEGFSNPALNPPPCCTYTANATCGPYMPPPDTFEARFFNTPGSTVCECHCA